MGQRNKYAYIYSRVLNILSQIVLRKNSEMEFFFLFNYFCCPRRCAYTILEVFYYIFIYRYYMATFYRFLVFAMRTRSVTGCFVSYLSRRRYYVCIEAPTLASYPSAAVVLVLVLTVSGTVFPIGNTMHHLRSYGYFPCIHYEQYCTSLQQTRVNVGIFSPCGN